MKKPIVIYHGNCADGFTAAWCFWRAYGDTYDYHKGVYGEAPPDVSGREVFLVDFSYPRNVLLKMGESATKIIVLDHHASAMKDLNAIEQDAAEGDYCPFEVVFDMNRSGAGIAWDYLNPDVPRPTMVNHVEDRDLWRFALPNTKEIQTAVFSYEYNFQQWDDLMNADVTVQMNLIAQGQALYRKHMKDVKELIAFGKHRMDIGGHNVPVCNLPYTMSSEAGHIMAEGEPFAACYMDTATHRVFSLRSTDAGLDVAEVAKMYGGGGHRNAAGFKVKRGLFGVWSA